MVWRILGLSLCLIGISCGTLGEIEGTCPHQCPGECTLTPALWLEVQDPELGISRMRCVQAECPLTPWCFEVYGVFPGFKKERLLERLLVSSDVSYLSEPGIHATVEKGKAPIVLVDKEGGVSVTKVPEGGKECGRSL